MTENKQNAETENTTASSNKATAESASATKRATDKTEAGNGESVSETLNKAKDAVGEAATQAAGQAKDKAASLIGDQKSNLAAGISNVADSIRQAGEHLREGDEPNPIAAFAGRYGNTVAEQVERVSHYIEDKDLRELAQDVEKFARRNPTLFVGGAFALGILAARFLKSSGSRQTNGGRRLNSPGGKASSKNTTVQAS